MRPSAQHHNLQGARGWSRRTQALSGGCGRSAEWHIPDCPRDDTSYDDDCLRHVYALPTLVACRTPLPSHPSPSYIPAWLSKSNPALDSDKPIDRIAQGDYRSVARLISGLEDPGAS